MKAVWEEENQGVTPGSSHVVTFDSAYYYEEKTREYKQLGEEVTVSTDANLIIKNIYDGLKIVVESSL